MPKRPVPLPSQDFLRGLFDYDPETGVMVRKRDGRRDWRSGGNGYSQLNINGKPYLLHRIIWQWVHGDLRDDHIDHVNGQKLDNRLDNLRLSNDLTNSWNKSVQSRNSLGFKGVRFDERKGLYRARITCNGKSKELGSFKTPEAAARAYRTADLKLRGFFSNPGGFREKDDVIKEVASRFLMRRNKGDLGRPKPKARRPLFELARN